MFWLISESHGDDDTDDSSDRDDRDDDNDNSVDDDVNDDDNDDDDDDDDDDGDDENNNVNDDSVSHWACSGMFGYSLTVQCSPVQGRAVQRSAVQCRGMRDLAAWL